MKTDLTINVQKSTELKSVFDIAIPTGWEYLESTNTRDGSTYSIFKWGYTTPSDQFLNRIILIIGEWDPVADQPNKYFVRGSISTTDSNLCKFHTFKSVQDHIDKVCADTDKYYETENYETRYPNFRRYGIRPTEVEIEAMDNETRAKYPKKIAQL